MYGLDLFSGIGGITEALADWVTPIAYCEYDKYVRSVLCSRMLERKIPCAPIWDDVRTLKSSFIPPVDIIYGGFPCQDISAAGRRVGLDGKRSALYWELHRLVDECRPAFVFLENVPGIRTRGLGEVVRSLADVGYDSRWTRISAESVGAPHIRERWFLLAHNKSIGRGEGRTEISSRERVDVVTGSSGEVADTNGELVRYESGRRFRAGRENQTVIGNIGAMADTASAGRVESRADRSGDSQITRPFNDIGGPGWWDVEPDVGRMANGVQFRVDRVKSLGNAVVPQQAKAAYQKLMGFT